MQYSFILFGVSSSDSDQGSFGYLEAYAIDAGSGSNRERPQSGNILL